jgi:hypothetical protein
MSEVHQELNRYLFITKKLATAYSHIPSVEDIHKAFETKDRNVLFYIHDGVIPPPAVE